MESLIKYLQEYFGVVPRFMPFTKNELALLPLYLTGNYTLYRGSIIDQNIIWAKVKSDGSYTPERIKKQGPRKSKSEYFECRQYDELYR
jgi:hypothetical protein